jgi:hypothetical protein
VAIGPTNALAGLSLDEADGAPSRACTATFRGSGRADADLDRGGER